MSDSYTKQLLQSRREAEAKRAREAQLYLDKLHDEQLKRRGETRPATKTKKIGDTAPLKLKEEDSLEEDIPFALALKKLKVAKSVNQLETSGPIRTIPEREFKFDPTAKASIRDQQLKRLKNGGRKRTTRRTRKRTTRRTTRRTRKRTTKSVFRKRC